MGTEVNGSDFYYVEHEFQYIIDDKMWENTILVPISLCPSQETTNFFIAISNSIVNIGSQK